MLQKLIDGLCRVLSFAMAMALLVMVVLVFGNVVLRYGFNRGITLSEELSRWLFVWLTFLGALVALRNHAHLGTDSLVARLPVAGKKVCLGATHLLMIVLCGLMLKGAWVQLGINREATSPVMEVSMAWFNASGVFFAAFGILFVLNDFWKLVSGRLSDSELVGGTESDDVHHAQPTAEARRA